MRQTSGIRVSTMERPDLRAVEGIMTGAMLSIIFWTLALLLFH